MKANKMKLNGISRKDSSSVPKYEILTYKYIYFKLQLIAIKKIN